MPQFSILEFEMGLRGALRTMRKLNKICKWDLYKHCTRDVEETGKDGQDSAPGQNDGIPSVTA